MASLRRREGYLLIDNRASGGGLVEVPCATCAHCHRQVILNPGRTRERAVCRNCDRYVCDECHAKQATQIGCRPFNAILDQQQEDAFKAEQAARGSVLIAGS